MDELDSQYEAEGERREQEEHRRHQEAMLSSMFERYPPSSYEYEIIISGIRLERFVGDWECETCGLDCRDHTLGNMFMEWSEIYKQYIPVKVCVKDYLTKCKVLGIKVRL